MRLFLDRGAAARGGTGGGVAPVAVAERICRTLDGLPLAIELAAARLGTLSAAEIEAHLADRFRFLAYRRPAADPRHQALRAAMDWSYDLLSAEERRVLGELSVFAGTFGLAQAAEVCSGGDQLAALEVIDRLAGKSLVAAEPAEDGTRYRLLDTVRYYAADRLAEAGGTDAARQRHAAAFVGLAERERGLAALAREQDNFRAALEWSLSRGDQAGPRLARALGDFWLGRGLLQEGRDWLERALAQRPADQRLRADLLRLLGAVLFEAGDLRSRGHGAVGRLEVAAAAGAPAVQARIRVMLADVRNRKALGSAETLAECEAAAAVLESQGDLDGLAEALTVVGKLRFWLDDVPAGGRFSSAHRLRAAQRQSPRADAGQPLAGRDLSCAAHPGRCRDRPHRAAACRTPAATCGPKQTCSSRSACCMPTSAVSPTPARPSTAASRYSPASARDLPGRKAPSRPAGRADHRRPGRSRTLRAGRVRGIPGHGGPGIRRRSRRPARRRAVRPGPPR